MSLEVRPAEAKDLDEILLLFEETIRATCKNDYNTAQIESWVSSTEQKKKWYNRIASQFFIVAIVENKIVGFGSLENGNYLDLLYTHKDYLNQGLASSIYMTLKYEAHKLGHIKLFSDVSITAVPFFKKKGFQIIKKNINVIRGIEIVNYRMSK